MITHCELSAHLQESGFHIKTVAVKQGLKHLAISDELGVRFVWSVCDQRRGFQQGCPSSPHVHVSAHIRLAAGKHFQNNTVEFIPKDLSELTEFRGAPADRAKITKKQLPNPFNFKKNRFIAKEGNKYARSFVVAAAELLGPVGITENATVCEDMAAVPGEPIWWFFNCAAASSATFNLITDGDVWYPVNRRSYRITTQLHPKKSVDLSLLSVDDRDFLRVLICEYTQRM